MTKDTLEKLVRLRRNSHNGSAMPGVLQPTLYIFEELVDLVIEQQKEIVELWEAVRNARPDVPLGTGMVYGGSMPHFTKDYYIGDPELGERK